MSLQVVLLRQMAIVAVKLLNDSAVSVKDASQSTQFIAHLGRYLQIVIHMSIVFLHDSGVKLLLEALQGFLKAAEEHTDDVEVAIESGDTLDGNVLFKITSGKSACNLYLWWKAVSCGVKEREKFASSLRIAVPIDGPLVFDLAPLVKAADDMLADTPAFVIAKRKVAHLTIVQAAFRPLGSGEARHTFQEQGKAQVARLGVTVSPKFSLLLGKA